MMRLSMSCNESDDSIMTTSTTSPPSIRRRHHRQRRNNKKYIRRLFESVTEIQNFQERFEQRQIDDLRWQCQQQHHQLVRMKEELDMLSSFIPQLICAFSTLASSAGSVEKWLDRYQSFRNQSESQESSE